jgi:hypothetical protein
VFAIGGSAANGFAWKAKVDVWPEVPEPKPTPIVNPHPTPTGLEELFAVPPTSGTWADPEAVAVYNTYRERRASAFDVAAARELAVLTIAGVAWFLIRPKIAS